MTESACLPRRSLLRGAVAIAITAIAPTLTAGPKSEALPPQIGDELWFPSWASEPRAVGLVDIPPGPPISVFPYDPKTQVLKERSRLNQILLVCADSTTRDSAPSDAPAGSILAYSGICTHAACAVSEWNAETRRMVCPCHGSEFDPFNRGTVANGPARRALPALPITLVGDKLIVAGPFSAKVGAKKA
ncbi:MAG: ubiquinol-cytochrome c reductase iron-sulfur subunit [Gammaproteobacteria bacterium]